MGNFKAGDIVRLKSEIMRMTVEDVHDGRARCIWVNNKGDLANGLILEECLDLVNLKKNSEIADQGEIICKKQSV